MDGPGAPPTSPDATGAQPPDVEPQGVRTWTGGPGAPGGRTQLSKISYTHDAIIDVLIAHPMISQREIAARFQYTESWLSIMMASDAFKARLEMRRAELVDPTITATIEERFRALATKSLEVLQRKLEAPSVSDNLAIQAANLAARSLGLGAGTAAPPPAPPDRLERLGGRLLALLGNRAVASLDQTIVDAPAREISAPSAQEL